MNRTYIFKVVLITINAVCIVMSIHFVYQIIKIQEETITTMKKDSEKMDDKFEIRNTDLKEILQDYQKMQESYHTGPVTKQIQNKTIYQCYGMRA